MELAEGLRNLRAGAMFNLISVILVLIAIILIFAAVGSFPNPNTLISLIAIVGTYILLLIVASIVGLVGFILYFKATGNLKKYNPDYGIGRTGMILQIVGLIIMIASLGFFVASLTRSLGSVERAVLSMFGFIIVGAVIIVVGVVLFSVMLIRLGEIESGFKTAGILYLIGIVLSLIVGGVGSILGIVSTILIYTSAGRALEKL